MRSFVVRGSAANFQQEVTAGKHHFVADEPVSVGGGDAGPDPYDYLLTALGDMHFNDDPLVRTAKSFAARKRYGFALALAHLCRDCEECETQDGMLDRIDVECGTDRTFDSRTTYEADGDRSEMPGSSDAHLRNQYTVICREIPGGSVGALRRRTP